MIGIAVLILGVTTAFSVNLAMAQENEMTNKDWWPEKLNLEQLRAHDPASNPYGDDFDYAKAFSSVDLKTLKTDDAIIQLHQSKKSSRYHLI